MSDTVKKSELMTIRNVQPDDKSFIMATMLRGLYYGESWYSLVPKGVFMKTYHEVIEIILNKPETQVRVCCLKEDPTAILGYAILSSPDVLTWCFIKKSWRNIGLARDLVPNTVTSVTHLSKVGLSIIKKKNWIYNPFQI